MPATSPLELLEARLRAISPDRAQGDAWERALCDWINGGGSTNWTRAWLWNDWPERARLGLKGDKGVDLVATDRDGAFVAIQAKFRRDPDDPVTAPEVQKLVGSYRKHFAQFALVSNAHRASSGVAEAVSPADAMLVLRETLEAIPYDWSEARALPRPGFRPFPFQLQAAEEIRAALANGGRAQIVMACGTGKTVTMLLAMEALDAERVLVLAPTLLLVKQLRDEWVSKRTEGRPWASLAVCSDIGRGEDEADLSAAEIGAPATTDPEHIAAFLRLPGRRVVFGTYASSDRIAKAQEHEDVPAFDLALADEAHRIAGVVAARNTSERSQRVVLDEHRIRATRRLFATATPRVTSGARSRDGDEVLIVSMDDEARFGRVVHSITFQKAVELERLVPYKLVVTVVTEADVAEAIRERAFVDVNGEAVLADTLAGAIALRRAFGDLGISRIISYHARVDGARAFAELLPRVPGPGDAPTAEHVAGTMPVQLRKAVLKRLAEATGPTVVTNARCLTEGIDVPALDAVAFIDPRRSQVDIVQAVGRAMRRPVGGSAKTTGYVLLPVYLTAADFADPEAAVEGSAFEPVLRVLRALKDHDPLMARFVAKALVAAGARPLPRGQGIDEVLEVRLGQALHNVLAERLVEAVRLRAVEVAADPFERNLELLRRFVEREGHARVAQGHMEGAIDLGSWVSGLRGRQATLAPDRIARLNALHFVWDAIDEQFYRKLAAFERFVSRAGHARVPVAHVEDGIRIGFWASNLRIKRAQLQPERVAELDARGFVWDHGQESFDTYLTALRRYTERHGHARVPKHYEEDGCNLGAWVAKLRARRATLDQHAIEALDALGFVWQPRESQFSKNMTLLREYVAHHGHARVPQRHWVGGVNLGAWVSHLRSHQADLTSEQLRQLDEASFVWDPRAARRAEFVDALKEFAAREGHLLVPQQHVENGVHIGRWVHKVRRRRGDLGEELVAQLDALGFVWDATRRGRKAPRDQEASSKSDGQFSTHLAALARFVAREGHADVPLQHRDGEVKLGAWVSNLRNRQPRVAEQKVRQLAELGFIWNVYEHRFAESLDRLESFVRREGHANVPPDHVEEQFKLGRWVIEVRSRRETLTPERVASLDRIGFAWSPRADRFETNMQLLKDFVNCAGHALVPAAHVVHGVRLGNWVGTIRSSKESLSSSRVAALDALGFVWDVPAYQFSQNLRRLQCFVVREGHANVPTGHVEEDVDLGAWVRKLRARRASQSPDRIAQLDALGFDWSVRGKKSAREPHDAPLDMQAPEGTSDPEVRPGDDKPHDG